MFDALDEKPGSRASKYVIDLALAGVVRSFANSIEADAVVLLAAPQGRESLRPVARWNRSSPPNAVPRGNEALIARALEADGAVVEPGRAISTANGNGAVLVGRLAAPVRTGEGVTGALYAGFATPSDRDPGQLCVAAEAYARVAALSLQANGDSPAREVE